MENQWTQPHLTPLQIRLKLRWKKHAKLPKKLLQPSKRQPFRHKQKCKRRLRHSKPKC